MSRTLGFFLGSAVVFTLLVFILGQPVPLAPPVDRNLRSGTQTISAPIRIPAPAALREAAPVETPSQPAAQPSAAQSSAAQPSPIQPSDRATQSIPETKPVAQPEPVIAAAEEPLDENELTETWLASTSGQLTGDTVTGEPADTTDVMLDAANVTAAVVTPSDQQEWYAVWDPFHSELSANAFARRLERVTGLDYRVIKTSTTNYRVVMGYSSEEQRLVNLSMIEEATGLSINGGSL